MKGATFSELRDNAVHMIRRRRCTLIQYEPLWYCVVQKCSTAIFLILLVFCAKPDVSTFYVDCTQTEVYYT